MNGGAGFREVQEKKKAEQELQKKMQELQPTLPAGMQYEINYDVSKFLDASMEQVMHTLAEAFVLVALVVFVFLGDWR